VPRIPLGEADLPADFRRRVSQAAEGNPLFVEELLATDSTEIRR